MQLINDIEEKVQEATKGYSLSIENVLQIGFNLFRENPGIYILYGAITLVILSNPVSGLLLSGPMVTGYYIVASLSRKRKHLELNDFFRSFDKFIALLILHLLMTLLVTLGLILLVLPGIYLAVSYLFTHFFVWFYDVEPVEALRLSRKTVGGNFGQILLLCLVLTGINLLGALAFGVGILLTVPFSYFVVFATFDDIIGIP